MPALLDQQTAQASFEPCRRVEWSRSAGKSGCPLKAPSFDACALHAYNRTRVPSNDLTRATHAARPARRGQSFSQ